MALKKINAALGLLSILLILIHALYSAITYFTLYYNPLLTKIFAIPFMVVACLHAICGMLTVFLQSDGTRMDLYPKQNIRTILQRVSAALILPLLILHINTFGLLSSSVESGKMGFFVLLLIGEVLFFAVAITHVATSFSKAFITLGWLRSRKAADILDRVVYIICAVLFVVAAVFVIRGQLIMFLG